MKKIQILDLTKENEKQEAIERTQMIKNQIDMGADFEICNGSITVNVNGLVIEYSYGLIDETTFYFEQETFRGVQA